jgi:DNA-directed RNA polymerase subunit L
MKVEVLKSESEHLELKFDEDAHAILNLIKKKLLDNKSVTFVGYNRPHPSVNESILVVKTKGENPKSLVKTAISELRDEIKKLII